MKYWNQHPLCLHVYFLLAWNKTLDDPLFPIQNIIVKYIEKWSSVSYLHVMWSYLTSYDTLTDNSQRNKINTPKSRTFLLFFFFIAWISSFAVDWKTVSNNQLFNIQVLILEDWSLTLNQSNIDPLLIDDRLQLFCINPKMEIYLKLWNEWLISFSLY